MKSKQPMAIAISKLPVIMRVIRAVIKVADRRHVIALAKCRRLRTIAHYTEKSDMSQMAVF